MSGSSQQKKGSSRPVPPPKQAPPRSQPSITSTSNGQVIQPAVSSVEPALNDTSSTATATYDVYLGEKRDFDTIRKEYLAKPGTKTYYEDPEFPAIETSLYFSRHPTQTFEWLRPPAIAAKHGLQAELFCGTIESSTFAVQQGELGDCWVVAAIAMISEHRELLARVVPTGQSFLSGWYVGVFQFQFYHEGVWEEVIIDDRLPTVDGKLVFIHSQRPNEFWPALLEKAYAKLMGSYEALRSGSVSDVLHDITSGLVESYNFEKDSTPVPFLTNTLFQAHHRRSLIGCCINIPPVEGCPAAILSNGLITGQQYNVTDIREIKLASDKSIVPLTLIRVRNPWGKQREWKGAWSEMSVEWSSIAVHDRQAMGLLRRDEGEFWIDLKDFMMNFDLVDICDLSAVGESSGSNDPTPGDGRPKWNCRTFHGKWKRGVTAGGRPACKDTHWLNPQYKLTLTANDSDNESTCTALVELEQKDGRLIRHKARVNIDIGFVIYKCVSEFPVPLPKEFFAQNTFIARCDYFTNTREVTKRFVLDPGTYIIIPSTYEPDIEANFMLRVFTENENTIDYVDVSTDLPSESSGVIPSDPNIREKEEQFQRYFYNVAGEDMQINVFQFRQLLSTALKHDSKTPDLSLSVCKSLLSLVDNECSGKLDYLEFMYLWNMIKCWKKTFKTYDKNNQGCVNAIDLRSLIATLGYRLGATIVSRLVFRYASEQYLIDLDSFIACMVRILSLYDVFKQHEKNGKITCTLDEWLEISMTM